MQSKPRIGIGLASGVVATALFLPACTARTTPTMTGLCLGLAGALAVSRFLAGLLFGLTPLDPATFAAVAILFSAIAALASYIPARRAAYVDPLIALRCE